jgi:hypothetical protein
MTMTLNARRIIALQGELEALVDEMRTDGMSALTVISIILDREELDEKSILIEIRSAWGDDALNPQRDMPDDATQMIADLILTTQSNPLAALEDMIKFYTLETELSHRSELESV